MKKEICEQLDIREGTWDMWMWRDQDGLRTKLTAWRAERFLEMAEKNMPELLNSDKENIKADMTKFITETAGKGTYSKKSDTAMDLTSKGEKIEGFLVEFVKPKNESITPR